MSLRTFVCGSIAWWPLGCAPLTFSNEAVVDFERYTSVAIEMGGLDGAQRDARYLQEELQEASGFRTVTLDAEAKVSAILFVELVLERDSFSEDGSEYSVDIRFELLTPDGQLLHRGDIDGSGDSDPFDAAEDALTQLVSYYLPSYRI